MLPQTATNIEYLRQWLRRCPAIEAAARFGINFLDDDPTGYAIYQIPSSLAYTENVLGEEVLQDIQTINYTVAAKLSYSADIMQNILNAGFYDAVVAWIIDRNAARDFPDMVDGSIRSIVPTLTAYVAEAGSDAARYQIQIKITYKTN